MAIIGEEWATKITVLLLTLTVCRVAAAEKVLRDRTAQGLSRNDTETLPLRTTVSTLHSNAAQSSVTPPHGSDSIEDGHVECVGHAPDTVQLASLRWEEIGNFFLITAFVVVAGLAKLGFHQLSWLSNKVPESCLLVLLGLVVGIIRYFVADPVDGLDVDPCNKAPSFPKFSPETFFLILLPPIILDSAYSLHDRVFLDNLGAVLVFAVVGTLINVFAIGGALYGVSALGATPGMDLSLSDAFLFSSLISAVDPVAVLAIFQELCVNQNLYFLVFGESLLNDGVTVVLYNTMKVFHNMTEITIGQVFLAILSFFIASLGGIFIGAFFGVVTALVTRCTHSVRVVEPLAMLALAYLSYLSAELFHFSGIISLIVCGLAQAHYGFYNISQKSYICVKYFTKMASATSDTIIFMFLGMVLVNDTHQWNTGFVLWTLLFCLVFRFISVFSLAAILNAFRTKPFGLEEQFIAAYGGLRGAVAFSLVKTLDEGVIYRNIFIFTTLIVIIFTVFVQGITIRPLVQLLNIQKHKKNKKSLNEEIAEKSMDHMMAGVEEILGHHGDFYLRELIMHYNDKYLKKILLHEESDTKLTRLFEKIALSEHYAHLYGPVMMVEDNMKPIVNFQNNTVTSISQRLLTPLISEDAISQELLFGINGDGQRTGKDVSIIDVEEQVPIRKQPLKRRLSRRKTDASISPDTDNKNQKQLLRKAFKDNRYSRLHYTYNRNLIEEEDQEMSEYLNRRSLNAQRMSAIATANYSQRNSLEIPNASPNERIAHVRAPSFRGLASTVILLRRHERRSMIMRGELQGPSSAPTCATSGESRPFSFRPKSPPIQEETEDTTEGEDAKKRTKGHGQLDDDEWQREFIPLLKMPAKKQPPPV